MLESANDDIVRFGLRVILSFQALDIDLELSFISFLDECRTAQENIVLCLQNFAKQLAFYLEIFDSDPTFDLECANKNGGGQLLKFELDS